MTKTKTTTFDNNPSGAWNTGRYYTSAGQRIAWEFVATTSEGHVVSFADHDRMIDGTVTIDDDALENWNILRHYDQGGYGWDTDRERVRRLYKTASEVAPRTKE